MFLNRFFLLRSSSGRAKRPSRKKDPVPSSLFRALVILTLLLAPPGSSQAMKFITPADFPPPGGILTITEDTTLQIGAGLAVTIDFRIKASGAGANFFIENYGSLLVEESYFYADTSGTITIYNHAATGNFTWNNPTALIVNGALTVTNGNALKTSGVSGVTISGGIGNFTMENDGRLELDHLSINVYGGTVAINNRNVLSGAVLNILDQVDGTRLNNTGALTLGALNLTSNGASGLIDFQNGGTVRTGVLSGNANYGGQITIDTQNGTLCTGTLSLQALGSSHGVQSKITVMGTIWDHCQVLFLPLIVNNPCAE